MLARIQPVKERNKWEAQKEYFAKEIEKNKTKYNQLKTGDENLEKYAREQYYMQKEDEEVFVIKTEPKKKNTQESKKETH
jgi:cell division protein FtsB